MRRGFGYAARHPETGGRRSAIVMANCDRTLAGPPFEDVYCHHRRLFVHLCRCWVSAVVLLPGCHRAALRFMLHS